MSKQGSTIANLRREAGYTQKTLAEALNITDKAISKWERGICLPDVSLLPKLSLLLDADMDLLLSDASNHTPKDWMGVIDLSSYPNIDLRQKIYDKPMVYYMLAHFLLLNINEVCVLTNQENRVYLDSSYFRDLGFKISFDIPIDNNKNLMIMNTPFFLFGSDLTHQFQGAMLSDNIVALVPTGVSTTFLFCPTKYADMYFKNPEHIYKSAAVKTLGRGMVCIKMDDDDNIAELSSFVKMYQKSTGLKLGDLEEIADRQNSKIVF